MARFLICSFALVLLYPSGIDMYLVGLPRIAQDLGASEAQLHIAFSVYLAGMAAAMLFAGRIASRWRFSVPWSSYWPPFSARRRRSAPTS